MQYEHIEDQVAEIISTLGAHPFSMEVEAFINSKISNIADRDSAIALVKDNAPNWFQSYNDPPEWIQSPDWKFLNGQPLVFVGQIDTNSRFHSDASFYIFWDPQTGVTETVIQIG